MHNASSFYEKNIDIIVMKINYYTSIKLFLTCYFIIYDIILSLKQKSYLSNNSSIDFLKLDNNAGT